MKKLIILVLTTAAVLVAACGGGATATPDTAEVPVVTDNFAVVAEGRLLPGAAAKLSFAVSGNVAEIPVSQGQAVQAGDLLARLENSQQLQAQVSQAQAEVLNAQQALDRLKRDAGRAKANAEADLARADKALDDAQRKLKNLNYPDISWYQEQIQKARDALQTAQENVTVVDLGSLQAALQAARDAADKLNERLGKVQAAVNGCPTCDPKGSFTVDHFSQTLQEARDNYNDGLNRIKELEIQIAQAQRGNSQAIKDAQDHLQDTLDNLNAAQRGPKPLDVELAQANAAVAAAAQQEAQARLARLQAGPDPDELAAAQAALAAAQASLAAAEAGLKNSELRAPFSGVIAAVLVKVGEQATPGEPAAVLADFSQWVVETDNLTEIEVVKVAEGQAATIALDALPGVTLHGRVTGISPVFEEKRGDVTYTVRVALSDAHPLMRWGMTAVTTFEK